MDCTLEDGTGVAKIKLRDEKAVQVFGLTAEDLKSLEFEVKGRKQTLMTYKSELFRRMFRASMESFTIIGKPQCKVRIKEVALLLE